MQNQYKISLQAIVIVSMIYFYSCNNTESIKPVVEKKISIDSITLSKPDIQKIKADVLMANHQVLVAIKNKDYKTFATFIHPVKGIRFSPNAYLDSTTDKILSAKQFNDLTSKNWKQQLVWESDMEGDSIQLTVGKYFEKYLNDLDFYNAPEVAFNKILRSEIDEKVMKEVYGKYPFVDNHFPGFDKKNGEMDWLSLRLVFDKFNGKYYVIGIIRDQWDI